MKHLRELARQFMILQTRERVLAVAAFIGVLYFLFDLTLMRSQRTQAKALQAQIAQQETQRNALEQTAAAMSMPGQNDPLAKQRAERDELRANFARAQSLLSQASGGDVSLADVVRASLASRGNLVLAGLKTLPVAVVFSASALPAGAMAVGSAASAASGTARAPQPVEQVPTLYKHGVEVTLRGDYASLLAYMRQLERSTKGAFWGDVKLVVGNYPEATLTMTILTLSARPELSPVS